MSTETNPSAEPAEPAEPSPSTPPTFHHFNKLPIEVQDQIWSYSTPLTRRRLLRLQISETSQDCAKGETRLQFSSLSKPSPFLSMCKSARYAVLKELPTEIVEGTRIIRYNADEDVIMLYQMHKDHQHDDKRHICAPELDGKLVTAIKNPAEYPHVMKVFGDIKHLTMHFRWAPSHAPWNIKGLFMARFTKLDSFSLLFHPYTQGHYVFEPVYTHLDIFNNVTIGLPEPPSTGSWQAKDPRNVQGKEDRARLPCQDLAWNTEFPSKGHYIGDFNTWKARLMSRYLSYLEEYIPDEPSLNRNQGFPRQGRFWTFPNFEGSVGEDGWRLSGRVRLDTYNVPLGTKPHKVANGHPIQHYWKDINFGSEDGISDDEGNHVRKLRSGDYV